MLKLLAGAVAGGVAGAGVYFLMSCTSGTCPIVRNPVTAIIVFAIAGIGITAVWNGKKDEKKDS